jgi:hypothetical protein
VNPLPRTPLEVVAVRPTASCTGVSFSVASPTSVAASWNDDTPGASCTAVVTLRDAQGRTTASTRDARVTLDLLGYPRSPASVRQTAFADGSLTLRVDPGEAGRAYPGLSGFTVRTGGQTVGQCAPDGSCPPISAPNGEQREYVVTAVNAVGESRGAVRTTGWAYRPPAQPRELAFTPVQTSGEGNVADLLVSGVDGSETGALEISSPVGQTVRVDVGRNQDQVQVRRFVVGSNTATSITVRPISRFTLPPGLGGASNGSELVGTAHGVGVAQNLVLNLSSRSTSNQQSTVVAEGSAQPNGTDVELKYDIAEGRSRCQPTSDSAREEFPNRNDGESYDYTLCVETFFQGESYGAVGVKQSLNVAQNDAAPEGYTFRVNPDAEVKDNVARWFFNRKIEAGTPPPRNNKVVYDNWGPGSTVFGRDPNILVYFQHDVWDTRSQPGLVKPAQGSAPYQVQASWTVVSCEGGGRLVAEGTTTNGAGSVTPIYGNVVYRDASGTQLPTNLEDPTLVPVGATTVDRVGATVAWSDPAWNLNPKTVEFAGTCRPGTPTP